MAEVLQIAVPTNTSYVKTMIRGEVLDIHFLQMDLDFWGFVVKNGDKEDVITGNPGFGLEMVFALESGLGKYSIEIASPKIANRYAIKIKEA